MQVLPVSHMPARMPSPTLTNPDLILPFENPVSNEPSPASKKDTQFPSPVMEEERTPRSGSTDQKPRLKNANHSLSPFRNGVLAQSDNHTRLKSKHERGHGRIRVENSRLSYRPNGERPSTSSPTEREGVNDLGMEQLSESPEEDEEDPESHAAMTRRAEEILANAKKRLTNMEGNLSRARSTLGSRPSSSMSSFADREPPLLQTMQRERRAHGGYSPLKHRQANSSLKDDAQGHLRISSETSVPSSLQTTGQKGQVGEAMDSERNTEPARFWNGMARSTSLAERHKRDLQSLDEDGPALHSFGEQAIQEEEEEGSSEKARSPFNRQTFETSDFSAQPSPTGSLSRSRSTTQMRDLREQMTDLKGKISTLKQRAREDSLRRRSLQTLRTPSPLTNADVDYSEVKRAEEQNGGTGLGIAGVAQPEAGLVAPPTGERIDGPSHAPIANTVLPHDQKEERSEVDSGVGMAEQPRQAAISPIEQENVSQPTKHLEQQKLDGETEGSNEDLQAPMSQLVEPTEAEEGNGEFAELTEEPSELRNSPPGEDDFSDAIGERHEDRADAFDYEHFFLHSSMGHYGRKRSSTHSSNYSTETERPPTMVQDGAIEERDESPGKHVRQNSNDSISTAATFATATEGEGMEEVQEEDEEEEEWTPRQTMAGTWLVDAPKEKENDVHMQRHLKTRARKEADLKRERSKKRHRREHSVTENGVEAPSEEVPDIFKYLSAIVSRDSGGSIKELTLNDSDKELAERVVKSLAKVCRDLHEFGPDRARYEARVCRRKLDTARRHLDGEVNGEAF